MDVLHKVVRHLELLGLFIKLVFGHGDDLPDFAHHHAHMAHRLHDVARAGLALGTDHGSALRNAAERLAEVSRPADKGNGELGLIDVILIVGGREHFALVDVVDLDGLQDLRLDEVADAALRHDGDGDGVLDALDHLGVGHTGDAARRADVGGDAFERHDGARARFLCDPGLFGRGDVHDDAAFEHLGKALVEFETFVVHIISSLGVEILKITLLAAKILRSKRFAAKLIIAPSKKTVNKFYRAPYPRQ